MIRLALYVFYHKDGILEEYILYYLKGLKAVCSDVVLIANGGLTEEAQKQLDILSIRYLMRENRGIDFAAWKAGLEYIGWDKIRQYDELILCNCSCYGPVYPFSEAFDRMKERVCDFWGINRQPDMPQKLIGASGTLFPVTEHIQSYFYVFRRSVFLSDVFRSWWENLVEAGSYWEEIREHELKFSHYLENAGFIGDTLMDFHKYREASSSDNPWITNADVQLIEDRNPLVKRKLIFSTTDVAIRVLEHIHYHTEYPVELVLKDNPNRKDFSLVNLIRFHVMKHLCTENKRYAYEIKEKKALLWYYLLLQIK